MSLLDQLGVTARDLIDAVIHSTFIIDLGIVTAVDAGKTHVDVQHVIKPSVFGEQLGATETKDVELLWLSSKSIAIRGEIANGDVVLLVGLKHYVKTAAVSSPGTTDIPLSYTQETMKAIPLSVYNAQADITIEVVNGVLKIAGGGKGAARKDDSVQLDLSALDVVSLAGALLATTAFMPSGSPPAPSVGATFTGGKITGGSTKVEIG